MTQRHPPNRATGTATSPDVPAESLDTETITFERSPLDVYRLVVYTAGALVVVLSTKYLREGTDGLEENLSSLLSVNTQALRDALDVTFVVGTFLASLAVLVVPLVMRRWRVFGYVLSANLLAGAAIAAVDHWVGDLDPRSVAAGTEAVALDVSTDVVSATQMIASFVAVAPFVGRRWRRFGLWLVVIFTFLRLVVANGQSTHVLMVFTVGAAVGSGVLLAFGRPSTQPSAEGIIRALAHSGLAATSIRRASVDARGSVPWFAELDDGSEVFVKVLGTNQRAADLLFRLYRMVRLRNVGDERPFSSLRRTVEHEALVALAARDVGVRTPRLRAVCSVGADSFVLAYDLIEGASLDSVEPDELTDEVLEAIWKQVALLRQHRIAHRDLRLANVFLADSGGEGGALPWLIDFGFSEVAADDSLLSADLAQLLTSLALAVGPQRAVSSAVATIGADDVAGSLARLQPAAMSGSTQKALKAHEGLLEELRVEVERRCAVAEPELEPVTRFTGGQVLSLALIVAVIYFLAPRLADLPGLFGEVRGASWWWLLPILASLLVTYLAATASLLGSVAQSLPPVPTLGAEVASSFAGKVAPAGLGGMTLKVRYLQKQGLEAQASASAVGLNSTAGVVGHTALLGLFAIWAGREATGFGLDSPRALLVGLGVAVLFGAVALVFPHTRSAVGQELLPILQGSRLGLEAVLAMPARLVLLATGSTAVTLTRALAFFFAARAFGVEDGFATIAAVYLVGSAVAALAPTPGGLGAVEAALIGALMAIGVDADFAVPCVFLYRLATFWFPLLPGWVAFRWLRHTDRL